MPPGGVTVELEAPELAALAGDLRRASEGGRRQLARALAAAGESAARGRITRGGPDPDGRPWPRRHPLSRSRKPLLNRDGHLHDSLSSGASVDGSTAHWGTDRLVYARIHQLGGVVRPRRRRMLRFESGGRPVFARRVVIPARPYLGWGEGEKREASRVVRRWLERALPGGAS